MTYGVTRIGSHDIARNQWNSLEAVSICHLQYLDTFSDVIICSVCQPLVIDRVTSSRVLHLFLRRGEFQERCQVHSSMANMPHHALAWACLHLSWHAISQDHVNNEKILIGRRHVKTMLSQPWSPR